ncbi:MAG: YceI family protein [Gemmatimonadales bacterium]|nr:MAG: YceI family protein [Gemmatimonadales bacterium]
MRPLRASLLLLASAATVLALAPAGPADAATWGHSPAAALVPGTAAAALVPGTAAAALVPEPAAAADTLIFVVAEEGNEARYRVREQLARLDFPNDAVGVTRGIQGRIMLTSEGDVVSEGSRFLIDLHGLESDSDRRDNYLRRRTLDTEAHPDAIFVPTNIRELPVPLPESGEATVIIEGDLTLRGATRPVEWTAELEFWEGAILGQARTSFTFGEFDLEVPSVGSVLSIRDEIRLEFDVRMVPEGGT